MTKGKWLKLVPGLLVESRVLECRQTGKRSSVQAMMELC